MYVPNWTCISIWPIIRDTYSLTPEGRARALIEEDERPTANHHKGFVWDWKAPLNAQCPSTALSPKKKKKKKEKGKTRESEKERDGHGHVESSQPFLGTKKGGIGGRGRLARWKPLWRRPRQIWQLAGRVHMWARKGRKGPPRSRCRWKRERAAWVPLRPPLPPIPRLFLFFLFGTVGDRGAFIHARIPRMQRACECVRYTYGAPGGGPHGGTWRRGWDDYFHYVDLQDEKRVEPKKWWNIRLMYIIIIAGNFKKYQYYCCSFFC